MKTPKLEDWTVYAAGIGVIDNGRYAYTYKLPDHPSAEICIEPMPFPARHGYFVRSFAVTHPWHVWHGKNLALREAYKLAKSVLEGE